LALKGIAATLTLSQGNFVYRFSRNLQSCSANFYWVGYLPVDSTQNQISFSVTKKNSAPVSNTMLGILGATLQVLLLNKNSFRFATLSRVWQNRRTVGPRYGNIYHKTRFDWRVKLTLFTPCEGPAASLCELRTH